MLSIGLLLYFQEPGDGGEVNEAGANASVMEIEGLSQDLTREELVGRVMHARESSPVYSKGGDRDGNSGGSAGETLTILSDAGHPLDGVSVFREADSIVLRVLNSDCQFLEAPKPLGVSGDDGMIHVRDLGLAQNLVASRPGYQPLLFSLDLASSEPHVRTLKSVQSEGIQVVASTGEPIAGAQLLVEALNWGWSGSAPGEYLELGTADVNGILSLCNPVPACSALVVADGYCMHFFELGDVVRSGTYSRIVLPDAAVAGGVIRDAPIDSRVLVLAELESNPKQPPVVTPASFEGLFEFSSLLPGQKWSLTPCRRINGSIRAIGPSAMVWPPERDVELVTFSPLSLQVRALDALGDPVEVDVRLSLLQDEFLARHSDATVQVSSDGQSLWPSLHCPPPLPGGLSNRELWVVAEGFLPVQVGEHRLVSGAIIDLGDVVLRPVGKWRIQVASKVDQLPIGEAKVTFVPRSVLREGRENSAWLQMSVTGEGGWAELRAPEDEALEGMLKVEKEGWRTRLVTVAPGDGLPTEVLLERPAGVLVECVSLNGEPVPGASIQWRSTSEKSRTSRRWSHVTSARDGFAMFDVPPGNIQVRYAPGMLRGSSGRGMNVLMDLHSQEEGQPHPSEPVDLRGLEPGDVRPLKLELPVVLNLEVVVYVDGSPSAGDTIVGIPGSGLDVVDNDLVRVLQLPSAITDSEGRCRISMLPLGVITLVRIEPGTKYSTFKVMKVGRSMDSAIYFMSETRPVPIRVLGVNGMPLPNVDVQLEQVTIQHGARTPRMREITAGGARPIGNSPQRVLKATTDEAGEAIFQNVPVDARFSLGCRNSGKYPLMANVRVEPGGGSDVVELRDGSAAEIIVALHYRDGELQAGVSVVFTWNDVYGRKHKIIRSASDEGVVRFSSLNPGWYTITVPSGDTRRVEVEAGQTFSETWTMR
jgi:hypothetical protein